MSYTQDLLFLQKAHSFYLQISAIDTSKFSVHIAQSFKQSIPLPS